MKGRFLLRWALLLSGACFFAPYAYGQEDEALNADYSIYPLNLNQVTEEELTQCGLLSHFQVLSLLEYRREFGALLSWNELTAVPGFTPSTCGVLEPFFYVGPPEPPKGSSRHQLLLQTKRPFVPGEYYAPITAAEYAKKPNSRYLGVPWQRYARYEFRQGDRWRAGITAESDMGEPAVADFISAFAQYTAPTGARLRKHLPLRQLIVGDYRARFGHGLVVWNGFAINATLNADALCLREKGLSPYTSRNENDALRGVGVVLGGDIRTPAGHAPLRWEATVFGSYRKIDARVVDGAYTSLIETGYHRTPLELERKNAMGAWVAGVNGTLKGTLQDAHSWQLGATAVYRHYQYPYAKTPAPPIGAAGLNGSLRYHRWRLFGEAAVNARRESLAAQEDSHLHIDGAALLGAVWYGRKGTEVGGLLRWLGATYEGVCTTGVGKNSTSCNEQSVQVVGTLRVGKNNYLKAMAYVYRFPEPRYRTPEPSYGWDVRTQWERPLWYVQARVTRTQQTQVTYKPSLRAHGNVPLGKGWEVSTRIETAALHTVGEARDSCAVEWGALAYLNVKYATPNGKWTVALRGCAYHTQGWDSRMYAYENDVQGGFSTPALYGKGGRMYVFLRSKPLRWLDIWFKTGALIRPSEPLAGEVNLQVRITLFNFAAYIKRQKKEIWEK